MKTIKSNNKNLYKIKNSLLCNEIGVIVSESSRFFYLNDESEIDFYCHNLLAA